MVSSPYFVSNVINSFMHCGTDAEARNVLNVNPADGINYNIISSYADFPTSVGGVITLSANNTYFITTHIDLSGDRIQCGGVVAILGSSSEIASLRSTGLSQSSPLISSQYTLPMQNITLSGGYAVNVNTIDPTAAVDWYAVNFLDCPKVGKITNAANWIYSSGAFLNSGDLEFDGTIGTIGIDNCLLDGRSGSSTLKLLSGLTVGRRFRAIYSSMIANAGVTAIDISNSSTIPAESFIMDNVNFSGAGTYTTGLSLTSNKSLIVNCTNVENTSVNAQMYLDENVTSTPISASNTWFKVVGTTTASDTNRKYVHASNRLTNAAVIRRKYLVQGNLSFTGTSNNVYHFGFYDSTLNTVEKIQTPSHAKSTANASGKAENVAFFYITEHNIGDYIEVWVRNISGSNSVVVNEMNVTIAEI